VEYNLIISIFIYTERVGGGGMDTGIYHLLSEQLTVEFLSKEIELKHHGCYLSLLIYYW
jgi:hypothetical protein